MNIALLLSGGVDSAVALHLLTEQGHRPDLYYIKIGMEGEEDTGCTAEEDMELCQATARRYGLPLQVIDLQKEYWERPNPDVMCNRLIKFGAFEEQVGHRYDKIATGHYATIVERDGKTWLGTAKDPVKDQTDFLAQLPGVEVQRLLLPIGHLMKEEVRRIALEAKLPPARRKDSQGICFLGKIDYNDFLRRFLGEQEGKIIDIETNRILGTPEERTRAERRPLVCGEEKHTQERHLRGQRMGHATAIRQDLQAGRHALDHGARTAGPHRLQGAPRGPLHAGHAEPRPRGPLHAGHAEPRRRGRVDRRQRRARAGHCARTIRLSLRQRLHGVSGQRRNQFVKL